MTAPASFGVAAAIGLVALYRYAVHNRITLPASCKRRILVTGAGSGIGLATAELFKKRGWTVGQADLNMESCVAAQQKIGADAAYQLDVCDAVQCARVCAEFSAAFGGIDVLFNSAGLLVIGSFESEPAAKQTKQIQVNTVGVVNMTHAALSFMKKGARVVTMASGSALMGIPQHAVYSATKAFVYHLTEALNMELSVRGISVADVSVMYVATPMVHSQPNRDSFMLSLTQLFHQPDTVARTVWTAAHMARLHREHFYVGTDLALAFKFVNFCRAFGLRWAARAVYLTNMPQAHTSTS